MKKRQQFLTIFPVLGLALVLAGCPKKPATTSISAAAPPPTTAAPSKPSPAPSPGISTRPESPVASAPSRPAPAAPSKPATTAPLPPLGEFRSVDALKDIYFDFDKSDIRPADAKILEGNAQWLKTNAKNLLLIEGHADERGTNEYNLALGERRAKSAMNYLVSLGTGANRITVISYGEERPVCTEKAEECWGKNRRAHFLTKAQ
jgi:peptidoglycan-associated lipoprotein